MKEPVCEVREYCGCECSPRECLYPNMTFRSSAKVDNIFRTPIKWLPITKSMCDNATEYLAINPDRENLEVHSGTLWYENDTFFVTDNKTFYKKVTHCMLLNDLDLPE